ncbi:hypothetical protein ScPMuIL_002145, partial [Solemya velum]
YRWILQQDIWLPCEIEALSIGVAVKHFSPYIVQSKHRTCLLTDRTRPSKTVKNIKDVRRYLNSVSISKDGLLVVKRNDPLSATRECIVVPRQVLNGLLTALHLKLNHPSCHQLKKCIHRFFFALDMDKTIEYVTKSRYQCAPLLKTPKFKVEQSCGDPPESIGISFAADILKRERQLIFILRECISSYTRACLINNEQRETVRDALLQLIMEIVPLDGPPVVVRTGGAP